MPAPLFQYVWQYSNQTIQQLAEDVVNALGGNTATGVNTDTYIPISNGLVFVDSPLQFPDANTLFCNMPKTGLNFQLAANMYGVIDFTTGAEHCHLVFDKQNIGVVKMRDSAGWKGIDFDLPNNSYVIGDVQSLGNYTTLQINDNQGAAGLVTSAGGGAAIGVIPGSLQASYVSSNTAGASAGKYIKIQVDGIDYKLELLNP